MTKEILLYHYAHLPLALKCSNVMARKVLTIWPVCLVLGLTCVAGEAKFQTNKVDTVTEPASNPPPSSTQPSSPKNATSPRSIVSPLSSSSSLEGIATAPIRSHPSPLLNRGNTSPDLGMKVDSSISTPPRSRGSPIPTPPLRQSSPTPASPSTEKPPSSPIRSDRPAPPSRLTRPNINQGGSSAS